MNNRLASWRMNFNPPKLTLKRIDYKGVTFTCQFIYQKIKQGVNQDLTPIFQGILLISCKKKEYNRRLL